jgi:probable phosphoglycerate mutase
VKLILVRHGETAANVAGLLDTAAPGPALDRRGRAQAAALAQRLAGERIDAVFASTHLRARQTAAPLAAARGLETGLLPGIVEVSAGVLEGRADRDAQDRYCSAVFGWAGPPPHGFVPGGETREAFLARFDSGIVHVARTLGTPDGELGGGPAAAVVVSHGAAIRAWAGARAGNLGAQFILGSSLENTEAVVLRWEGGWTAESWAGRAVGELERR